jgi:hypothetical protein
MAHQPNVDLRSPRFGRSLEVRAVLVAARVLAALGRTAQGNLVPELVPVSTHLTAP